MRKRRSVRRRVTRRRARRPAVRRARRSNPPVRRRRRAVAAARPRRVRRYRRNPVARRRRSYKRNPSIMGLQLPSLKDFLYTGIGFAAAPGVEGFVSSYLPTDITANTAGRYAVKIGTVGLTAWAVRQFIGSSEGNRVLLGGAIYVAMSAIKDFMPGVIPGLGAYTPSGPYQSGAMLRRVGMGAYTGYGNIGAYTGYKQLGYAGAGVPVIPSRRSTGANTVSRFSRFQ